MIWIKENLNSKHLVPDPSLPWNPIWPLFIDNHTATVPRMIFLVNYDATTHFCLRSIREISLPIVLLSTRPWCIALLPCQAKWEEKQWEGLPHKIQDGRHGGWQQTMLLRCILKTNWKRIACARDVIKLLNPNLRATWGFILIRHKRF